MKRVPDLRIGMPVAITSMEKNGGTFLNRVVEAAEDKIGIVANASLRVGCLFTLETDRDWIMTEVSDCEADGDRYRVRLTALESVSKRDLSRLQEALDKPQPEPTPSLVAV